MAGQDPHDETGAIHAGDQPAAERRDGQPTEPTRSPGHTPDQTLGHTPDHATLRPLAQGRDLVALNRRQPPVAPIPPSGAPDTSDPAMPGADALDPDRILELSTRRSAAPRGARQPEAAEPSQPRIARILPARPAGPRAPSPPPSVMPRSDAASGPRQGPTLGPMVALREAAQPYLARLAARRAADDPPSAGEAEADTPAHAEPQDATSPAPACSLCHDAGFVRLDVPVGDKLFGHAVRCECKEREIEARERQKLRDLSSLKPFDKKTFETFDMAVPGVAEACSVARRYAEDPSGWLILQGGYGCGKTHLAAAIAHVREDAGESVFFSIAPDLLDHLRATFAPASEITYDELFDRVRHVGLLVLDDLGSENATAWATEKLFQIINYRYNYRLPTVITTNVRLLSHLDDRIRSRLSDLSLVRWVAIEAPDYRERHVGQGGSGGNPRPPRGGPPRSRGYGR